ncbi:MAG: phosphotransferase family protein, partial [Alphaproteobacteria bacterium]
MGLTAEEIRAPLEAFIAARAGTRAARITHLARLGGGAVQENWRIDAELDGTATALVLRVSSASEGVSESMSRTQEFALLSAVHAAGIAVPEPLWLAPDASVIGRPFLIMRFVPGMAAGHRLVKEGFGDTLAERLGEELARIHAIRPGHPGLDRLPEPNAAPAQAAVARIRTFLDGYGVPQPALEWAARWLERKAPPLREVTLVHRDFRTGNYLVEGSALRAVLDWEFAGWGDPD